MINSISGIEHALYINLASRTDRKQHVEAQLKLVGISAERFNAVKLPDGALGCSMSHLKCLLTAKEKGWDHVLICEDDITFTNPGLFIQQANKFLSKQEKWDVVYIDGLHTAAGVCYDIEHYKTIIKPGGFICGHDYGWGNIRHAIGEHLDDKVDATFKDHSWIRRL